CALLLLQPLGARAGIRYATVYWTDRKTVLVKEVLDKGGDAYGFYNDTIQSTGWGVLEIRAGYAPTSRTNEEIMFAAGYLEGYLTALDMHNHFTNLFPHLIKKDSVLEAVKDFLWKQDVWTRAQTGAQKEDPLWRHTGYITAQLDGLYQGAAERAKREGTEALSFFAVQFLNAVGDLLDLVPVLASSSSEDWPSLRMEDATKYRREMGHCSALIKVLPGYENILFAHSSWFTYASTLRVYKHWDFNITDPATSTARMSFSSYPGFLESLDDFYILGSGLVMLQTTNSIYNKTLFKHVSPQALFSWQRVRIANMMAKGGEDWAKVFSKYNSGTYNNQYMILDLKQITLKQSIADEALYIVEQIPMTVAYSDQTAVLRKGYWPSYNVPFHEVIYQLSGYPAVVGMYGPDLSYDLAPRAKIFRRDQGMVNDMDSMKNIMRYNNYYKDPYAESNPCKTICCREDLYSRRPAPGGCYDTKVSDFYLAATYTAHAINGPPVADGLPPFSWSLFNETIHEGLPETYNFSFILTKPVL
ncbi:phospholipase B-like 1, partial [Ailuropoda melanoleuca]